MDISNLFQVGMIELYLSTGPVLLLHTMGWNSSAAKLPICDPVIIFYGHAQKLPMQLLLPFCFRHKELHMQIGNERCVDNTQWDKCPGHDMPPCTNCQLTMLFDWQQLLHDSDLSLYKYGKACE